MDSMDTLPRTRKEMYYEAFANSVYALRVSEWLRLRPSNNAGNGPPAGATETSDQEQCDSAE